MVFKSIQTKEGPHMCSGIKFSIGIPNNGNIFEFLSILFLEHSIPIFFHIPSSQDLPANPMIEASGNLINAIRLMLKLYRTCYKWRAEHLPIHFILVDKSYTP